MKIITARELVEILKEKGVELAEDEVVETGQNEFKILFKSPDSDEVLETSVVLLTNGQVVESFLDEGWVEDEVTYPSIDEFCESLLS